MIDHIALNVSDLEKSKAFYSRALAPLGYEVAMEFEGAVGLAFQGKPDFWLYHRGDVAPVHVAFAAADRATVSAFHEAAVDAGGTDNGPPGIRAHYHEHYYGAFVHDPDGNNVEAVCHDPGGP